MNMQSLRGWSRCRRWFVGAVCVGLLSIAATNQAAEPAVKWDTSRTTEPEDSAELTALQDRVKKVVEKCSPATVGILIGFGAGSGVIVSEDGLVLTAAHVITGEDPFGKASTYEPGKECLIVLPDGKRVKAKTLGVNSDADSGMVQITDKNPYAKKGEEHKWPFLPVGKSADLKKGQWVVSLGHPGGPKSGRPPVARLGRVETNNKDLVRSNCTLVGGDSGGPLFDLDGNVIGIHSRIGLTLAQNIHVPTEIFQKQWEKLVAGEVFGKVAKKTPAPPVVGVVFPDDENDDAWVTEVDEEGPAGKAGLKAGDTITKVNGETVKSVKRFRELIKDRKAGEVVKVTLRRGTSIMTLSVTLGKRGS
jgi:serine protease Do